MTTGISARTRGTVLTVLASISFSLSGPLAKALIDAGLSPQQIVTARIITATGLLFLFVLVTRPALLRVRRGDVRLLVVYGVVGVAGVQVFYFAAVSRIPVGVAILIEYSSPLLVVLWVRFVRGTVLPKAAWLGTGVALVGLAMVAQVWQGLRLDAFGVLFAVAAAFCIAAYFLLGEHAVGTIEPLGLVTWGMAVGSAGMLVLAPPWTFPDDAMSRTVAVGPWAPQAWVLIVVLAVVATALAYLFSISALRHVPSNVASVLALTEPIVVIFVAWALLNQQLALIQLIGAGVLLAGATVVQLASHGPVIPAEAVPAPEPEPGQDRAA